MERTLDPAVAASSLDYCVQNNRSRYREYNARTPFISNPRSKYIGRIVSSPTIRIYFFSSGNILYKKTILKPLSPVVLYDVGANIGFIGIGLVNAGLVDLVVAFEPVPTNYAYLIRNIALNRLEEKVYPINAALSDRTGPVTMEISPSNHGDHRVRTSVSQVDSLQDEEIRKTVNISGFELDSFPWESYNVPEIAQVPSILWLDVQGFEGRIFKGADDLLQRGIPAVIEVSPYCILRAGMALGEFQSLLTKYWSYYWIDRGGRMTKYSIQRLNDLYDELGQHPTAYINIILSP